MKILIFRTFPSILDPKSYNSQEVGLARAFVRAGHPCDVAYYGGSGPARQEELEVPGSDRTVTLHWLPGRNFFKNGIFWGHQELLSRYDLIQVTEYDQLESWRLYRFWKGCPVTVYHGPYASEFTRGYNLKCRVFDLLFNSPKKNARVTAFAKSRLAEEFLRGKGFQKVSAVGVGLDPAALAAPYTPEARQETARQKELTLLYIGVLEERRSIPLLFETLAKVRQSCPEARLILVGRGEKEYVESCFARARELGVWDAVEYHEKVPQSQVYQLYNRANFFLLPTRYEIFGMVLLEAMYFGLPALSSWNGGSSVLIRDGVDGFILPEFDPAAYAGKILELAGDPQRQIQMGEAAHQRIQAEFLWDGIAAEMLKQYGPLVKNSES